MEEETGQETISTVEQKLIEGQVVETLRSCYDPEIPVNIYELGLVYDVKVNEKAEVTVTMTLTTPHCPAAQSLPGEAGARIKAIPRVSKVTIDVVWTPAWNPSMMSEAARLELGM